MRAKMVAVNQVEIRDRDGYVVGSSPTAIEAGEPEFAYCVHRADLHDALLSRLPATQLHLGHRLASIREVADRTEAIFENGRRIHAGLIVGADGLRSIVRTYLDCDAR